jgi:hypothetical protein
MANDRTSICLHNRGFIFSHNNPDGMPGAWWCKNDLCHFYLNFNPDTYPEGPAYTTRPIVRDEFGVETPGKQLKLSEGGKF